MIDCCHSNGNYCFKGGKKYNISSQLLFLRVVMPNCLKKTLIQCAFLCLTSAEKETARADGELGSMDRLFPRATH